MAAFSQANLQAASGTDRSHPFHLNFGSTWSQHATFNNSQQQKAPEFNNKSPTQRNQSSNPDVAEPVKAREAPPKASRACEYCRRLKSCCLPATDNPHSGQCKRCAKSGRECVFIDRSKTRRRKRTDVRVKELERDVKALISLLKRGPIVSGDAAGDDEETTEIERLLNVNDGSFSSTDGVSIRDSLSPTIIREPQQQPSTESSKTKHRGMETSASAECFTPKFRVSTSAATPQSKLRDSTQAPDVIDSGLLPIATATQSFDLRNGQALSNSPSVVFSQGASTGSDDPQPMTSSSSELKSYKPLSLSRRPHTKSRSGCKNCKKRRIKV